MNTGFFDGILRIVGNILWPLFSFIGMLINTFQSVFYAFAGVSTVKIGDVVISSENNGGLTSSGIVYYLFQSQLVKNIFTSILILALFLLIIFTAMAFIKNAYSSKQKTWQEIVGNAIKGLGNFIIVPVVSLLGVWGGNILLQAINGATSTVTSSQTNLDRQLFVSSAYNANRARDDENIDENGYLKESEADLAKSIAEFYKNWVLEGKAKSVNLSFDFDPTKVDTEEGTVYDAYTAEQFAEVVDAIFANPYGPNMWGRKGLVGDYYKTWGINFILLAGGGVFILYALGSIAFGMVKRLFNLILLFVISPAICSMYPLDDGSAVSKWKNDFIKNVTMAYSAVVGMNLFLSLVPIINSFDISVSTNQMGAVASNLAINPGMLLAPGDASGTGGIVSILINIAALYMVEGFISTLSGYITGGGDAYGEGRSIFSRSVSRFKRGMGHVARGTAKTIGVGVGAFTAANRRRKANMMDNLSEKEQEDYKKTSWSLNRTDEQKQRHKDLKEKALSNPDVDKGVAGSFFKELGKGVVGGLVGAVDWVSEKSGMGKGSDLRSSVTTKYKDTRERVDGEIKKERNGEFNELKLQRAMTDFVNKMDATESPMEKARLMSEMVKELGSGEYGQKSFDYVKQNPVVQESMKKYLADPFADVGNMQFSEFSSRVAMQAENMRYDATSQRISGLGEDDKIKAAAAEILGDASIVGAAVDTAVEYIRKGSTIKDEDMRSQLGDRADAENIMAQLREVRTQAQNPEGALRTLNVQRANYLQSRMENTDNPRLASLLASELAKVRTELASIKSGADMKAMNRNLSERLSKLIDAQKEFARKLVEATKQSQNAVVNELKKQQKKDK